MSKLLIASRNPGKIREIKDVVHRYVDDLLTPDDLGITEDPIEDGETFAENSLLKANFFWQRAEMPVIADDGGLEVDALGGLPGVRSRRWGGEKRSDEELRAKLLQELADVPEAERTARLTTVVTLRVTADRNFQRAMSIEGIIRGSDVPIDTGYPFRSIFYLPEFKKFFVELTPDEHERVNQRKRALQELLPLIQQYV